MARLTRAAKLTCRFLELFGKLAGDPQTPVESVAYGRRICGLMIGPVIADGSVRAPGIGQVTT